MRQYHARGLSPPENEAALERELEAARTACLPIQPVDDPGQATGPVQPVPPAADPVESADEPVQPIDEQSTTDPRPAGRL